MIRERKMKARLTNAGAVNTLLIALAALLFCARSSASPQTTKSKDQSTASSQTAQKGFATPQAAADALIKAAADFNVASMLEILGPDAQDLVASSDQVLDKKRAEIFATKGQEKHSVTIDPKRSTRAVLSVGNSDWPFPIPIVQRAGKWYFDSKAGREEILYRRIGTNELDAIQVCRGYVEAQEEYALQRHDGSDVNQYAQRIISSPGKQDGLAWQNADGTWGGPVGEAIAKVLEEGYTTKSQPFHGYYFKILKGQGPNAPLGEMDFVVKGAMIGGFALAAAPAEYRVTGVKTFVVSYDGKVYQKDLGPETLKIFQQMDRYNPDKTWGLTQDQWTQDEAAGVD